MQLEIIGGSVVNQGSTITINAGNSLSFRITNAEGGNCKNLRIKDIDIANNTDFSIFPGNPKKNIKPVGCKGGKKFLDFYIDNLSGTCATVSTLVTVKIKNQSDFTFTLSVNSSPEIYVLGGSPSADIYHGDTTTLDTNGTYFGLVDEGNTVTRRYIVANIGSCNLDVSSLSSSNLEFAVSSPYPIPWSNILPYYYIVIDVTFTAPVAGTGTRTAVISIGNTDNTTFTFTVSAEMFNFNIPGPGGVTADFRLWLKSTRGITQSASKVSLWEDLGSNGKDASQGTSAKQPTYLDTKANNINFNPVVKFENDGASLEQYLENTTNGFYSQDVFIVMVPDATMTSASTRNTVFGGISTGNPNDATGIGFGDYSTEFTSETLSYNQDVAGSATYNGEAELSSSYSNAGIINVRNNAAVSPTGQDILYNSSVLTTSTVNDIPFVNVGSPGPPTILGTKYWIGRNLDVQGSLNGRVAEIFTFAERVTDVDRQKIESYLAIKYGVTLGTSTEAQKNYINSFNTAVWDITANSGYNHHVAGIGCDSISDLNQKQSKTLNLINEVTIGLGGLFDVNSVNSNEFKEDGDFLVWGCNNAAFTGSNTNTVTIATGITTSLTRIDRKWKVIESKEVVGSDVENVFVGIPKSAFSSFTKLTSEEYVLIVADNANFANGDIIDVIPLKTHVSEITGLPILDKDGNELYKTWYNFDDTKYFTYGKAPKLTENRSMNIGSGDYLVGEYSLNLNVDSFSISAWIKCASNASTRTIMAKGTKLQLRLNSAGKVEVMIDDAVTPKFTSNMVLDDNKWHQTTFVYNSGTILLYVDGLLDKSVQDVVHPSPNYNHYAIGSVYIDKDNIINPLLGKIDEVYVWDFALSEAQIRYLMNQEIEKGVGDFIYGKVIPYAASSNELISIPWSDLRVYYDFNTFYGSTIEGLTDDRFFLRLKYLVKNKQITDVQTIPTPYVSANNGAWDNAVTWVNGSDNILPNSIGLNGTKINWNIVETTHNITSGDRDIQVLGLRNNSGTITVADPNDSQDETNSGQGLTVSHYLELDGVIDLVGQSQLVQSDGSIVDADSGGYIERDQQGTANSFNYNYWSSSVGPIAGNAVTRGTGISTTNTSYTITGVLNDGTISGLYQNPIYSTSPYAGDGVPPPPGVAKTISTAWMYKFYGPEDDYNAWAEIDETSSLLAGEGFTMKGTSGSVPITNQQNYVFKGLPNNGDVTLTLDKSSGDVDRLVGNPYPSAIDATEFILDNLSIADGGNNATGTVFNGALYFWDHFGEENTHDTSQFIGGYATRNLTGGAVAISNDVRVNNTGDSGSKIPGQYIAVNQGFFVSTTLDGFNNDNGIPLVTVNGGNIVFKNSQRVFAIEDNSTSLFFKSSKDKGNSNISNNTGSNPTIRLMYDSPMGYHRQIVIGKDSNASNNFDIGYDAFMVDVNVEDMYWAFSDNKFVIQGVNNFEESQEYALGVVVNKAGLARIKMDALENIDADLFIFIKDTTTGLTHQINNTPFETYLDAGTYNDRFKMVFQASQSQLHVNDVELEDKLLTYFDSESSEIKIINKNNSLILNIEIYNILGQEVKTMEFNHSKDISIPVNVSEGLYVLQINTSQGSINKKLVLK